VRKFGLTGYPLSHSFSKKYFSEKFKKEGITGCTYENYPLASIELLPRLLETERPEGLNVTIPYKEVVIPFLTRLDAAAAEIGAVNCIHFTTAGATGFNTDVIGFGRSLKPLLQPSHTRALILGTGGAAKAVAFTLTQLGIGFAFVSRKADPAFLRYTDLDESTLRTYTVIINTTPLGTTPNVHEAPQLPYHLLGPQHLLYDLVYNPPETLFLQKGKMQGARVKNGAEMLALQAEASWEIWNR
jgi:shikimate dehydrogenase